jgi:16S rRNA (cytidine1402-2'-O)-methyltransferase
MSKPASGDSGAVYLIPNTLGETSLDSSLPPLITQVIGRINHFVVEDEKSARRFIKQLCPERVIRELNIRLLNEHTKHEELETLAVPLKEGHDIGVISEAGCPAIADPGADLVRLAHQIGAPVRPLVGPCSMILALMASGMNGQRWRFLGYPPIEDQARKDFFRSIEKDIYTSNETQIVMDTPYRSQKLFDELLSTLRPETRLCVASALTTDHESIQSLLVKQWRSLSPSIAKVPTLFVLGR